MLCFCAAHKAHRNGIHKPKKNKYPSLKGVSELTLIIYNRLYLYISLINISLYIFSYYVQMFYF